MTAVNDAVQLIKSENIKGIDHIYSFFIPENYVAAISTTDLLVTDVGEFYTEYGSNKHTESVRTVAVNIYKGSKATGSLDILMDNLVTAFENSGWSVIYSSPIMIDPISYQKTKAFQFRNYRKREF